MTISPMSVVYTSEARVLYTSRVMSSHELVLHGGGDGALFTGLAHACADLLAVERLAPPVALDDHDGQLLVFS